MTTFFSPYRLGSQGDRMAMAHGVEARLPFLDHHVFDFAAALPTGSRLRGLKDKEILRRWSARTLSTTVKQRSKKTYTVNAPRFFGSNAPEWVGDHLSAEALRRVGVFSPSEVTGLVNRYRSRLDTGFADEQALLAVLSTQLWHHQFIESLAPPIPLPVAGASVMLIETTPALI